METQFSKSRQNITASQLRGPNKGRVETDVREPDYRTGR